MVCSYFVICVRIHVIRLEPRLIHSITQWLFCGSVLETAFRTGTSTLGTPTLRISHQQDCSGRWHQVCYVWPDMSCYAGHVVALVMLTRLPPGPPAGSTQHVANVYMSVITTKVGASQPAYRCGMTRKRYQVRGHAGIAASVSEMT